MLIDTLLEEERKGFRARAINRLFVAAYVALGLFETILGYFAFDRADDNAIFLEVVDTGVNGNGSLSEATIQLLYFAAWPARTVGGGELLYILWFRLLCLLGLLAAFQWVSKLVRFAEVVEPSDVDRARAIYMLCILLCPGLTAWTASLLRDGLSLALFFGGAYAWVSRDRLLGLLLISGGLLLRPQLGVLLAIQGLMLVHGKYCRDRMRPRLLVAALCIAVSLAGFSYRQELSDLFGPVFGEEQSYPLLESQLDLGGYLRIIEQAILDPTSITSIGSAKLFGILDSVFFVLILWYGIRAMSCPDRKVRQLLISAFVTLWAFAYFEFFVSGYSRHRLGPFVALIACTIIAFRLDATDHSKANGLTIGRAD
jgi:hypothetical protein